MDRSAAAGSEMVVDFRAQVGYRRARALRRRERTFRTLGPSIGQGAVDERGRERELSVRLVLEVASWPAAVTGLSDKAATERAGSLKKQPVDRRLCGTLLASKSSNLLPASARQVLHATS